MKSTLMGMLAAGTLLACGPDAAEGEGVPPSVVMQTSSGVGMERAAVPSAAAVYGVQPVEMQKVKVVHQGLGPSGTDPHALPQDPVPDKPTAPSDQDRQPPGQEPGDRY